MSTLPKKATYLKFNQVGSKWETYYFQTSADLVAETEDRKVLTKGERETITNYLTTFNTANKLVQVGSGGKIPTSVIPTLPYLSTGGGTVTGSVMSTVLFEAPLVTATTRLVSPEFRLPGATQSATNWRIYRSSDGLEIETDSHKMTIAGTAGDTSYLKGNWQMDAGYSPNNIRSIVNKGYVDNLGMGVKPTTAVRVASTGNVALTGITSIDGVALANGDRVLLKDQTTASQRGIYTWATGGTLSKAPVAGNDNQNGTLVRVTAGTVNKNDTFYAQDYSAGNWILFDSNLELIPGAGITVSGGTISISNGAISNAMLGGSIQAGKINLGAGLSNISNAVGISSGAITNAMLAGSIQAGKINLGAGLSNISNAIGIGNSAITNTMIEDSTISLSKLNKWALGDTSFYWTATVDARTTQTAEDWLESILSAIRLLRGTDEYNESNTQTIAGAYLAASNAMAAIPSITSGSSSPSTTGAKSGDLYFLEL